MNKFELVKRRRANVCSVNEKLAGKASEIPSGDRCLRQCETLNEGRQEH